ncbi:MAG: hypothetical protein E7642_06740 [Ruminococcaceae bacterium]|nr:hypothetical protein [Oscillospiraceae bacterium]
MMSDKDIEETRKLVHQMYLLYDLVEEELGDEKKILLQKYADTYQKFMFGVCATAYEQGYADALQGDNRKDEDFLKLFEKKISF